MSNQPLSPAELAEADIRIGRVFRRSLLFFGSIAALVLIGILLHQDPPPEILQETKVAAPVLTQPNLALVPPAVRFIDITQTAGIDFVHHNGAQGDKLLPETMGSGAAFFDYDNDGDPDLLLVNSRSWPGQAQPGEALPTLALYRNDGTGQFENSTVQAGLAQTLFGMGVAVADYNGDGWTDLFISALGRNRLYQNQQGQFTEVTAEAGVGGSNKAWSTAAAFFDYDGDADLDLLVTNYVQWSKELDFEVDFRLTGVGRAYGPPTAFAGTYPYLYRNEGHGQFTEVAKASGLHINNPASADPIAKSLAIALVDLEADGHMDFFVANDTVRNFLFHNLGNGKFLESGATFGLAFDRNGAATGAMGVDVAYFRDHHNLAFVLGNFANEMSSLYVAQGDPNQFADEAIIEGIGPASRLALSFGLFFFDYDLDGRLDLLQVNGHLEQEINQVQSSQHYRQSAQLFWNCGSACPSTFIPVPSATLADLATPIVGRGASYADIDADGDPDILLTQNGGPPRLLRNEQNTGHHWLSLKLEGRAPNREAIGAWVTLQANGITQKRQVMPTRSYLSQVELPIGFGLGNNSKIQAVTVKWPDGSEQSYKVPQIDRRIIIQQMSTKTTL